MKRPARNPMPEVPQAQPPEASRATYVVDSTPVLHDGALYQPGHDIELSPQQAERLGCLVRLAPTDPEPQPE